MPVGLIISTYAKVNTVRESSFQGSKISNTSWKTLLRFFVQNQAQKWVYIGRLKYPMR